MGVFDVFSKNKDEKLSQGLSKTRDSFFSRLSRAVAGKSTIDSSVLDDLEEVLITSDVGVETTIKIIERIEERVARDKYINTSELNQILKEDFILEGRRKRPPTDPINALISFGNSLMYTTVLGEMYKTQINPTVSFLHEPASKRFSLSLDLAEIFKPLIVDSIIFKLINNRVIGEDDFEIEEGICFLNEDGKKKFIGEYEAKLRTTIKHRKLRRKVSYRMFIRLECYKLIKHFIGDEIYKPLKAWW